MLFLFQQTVSFAKYHFHQAQEYTSISLGENEDFNHYVINNPSTPKIWLLILPFSCYTFPCGLVTRIWC